MLATALLAACAGHAHRTAPADQRQELPVADTQRTGTITGQVTSSIDGDPVPGATVVADFVEGGERRQQTAFSGSDGRYTLLVPAGAHSVVVYLGTATIERALTITAGQVVELDVSIDDAVGDGAVIFGGRNSDLGDHPPYRRR